MPLAALHHLILKTRPASWAKGACRARGGYSLVEVMVAMLLTSIMVTSVFSVALTVKTGGKKGEHKLMAAAGARQVSSLLKNYVTGATGALTNALIAGPCGADDVNWSISCNGIKDACPCGGSACYALDTDCGGLHVLTGVLLQDFENPPYGARVQYTVVPDGAVLKVKIETIWTEP